MRNYRKISVAMGGSVILLLCSLVLNVVLLLERSEKVSDADRQPTGAPPLWESGVRVRSIYHDVLLTGREKLSVQDVARDYCEGNRWHKLVVFPGLNIKSQWNPAGLCQNYHQIEWGGVLPSTFDLTLNPGDEVHVHDLSPPLHPDYQYEVTDFRRSSKKGLVGLLGLGRIEIGWVVCSEIDRYPNDLSGFERRVIQISAEDRTKLVDWIEMNRMQMAETPTNTLDIGTSPTEKAMEWHQWSWPGGTTRHSLQSGDRRLMLLVPEGAGYVFSSYEWD